MLGFYSSEPLRSPLPFPRLFSMLPFCPQLASQSRRGQKMAIRLVLREQAPSTCAYGALSLKL